MDLLLGVGLPLSLAIIMLSLGIGLEVADIDGIGGRSLRPPIFGILLPCWSAFGTRC